MRPDAAVPGYFYVREGPAEVDGDELKFHENSAAREISRKRDRRRLAIWPRERAEIKIGRAGGTHFLHQSIK